MTDALMTDAPMGSRRLQRDQQVGAEPWPVLATWFGELVRVNEVFRPMLEVVESVIARDAATTLAATRSMQDLVVTTSPAPSGPWTETDYVRVGLDRTRGGHLTGAVTVSHHSLTGPDDRIVRPPGDVVPLFWRLVIEKYGVHPARDLT